MSRLLTLHQNSEILHAMKKLSVYIENVTNPKMQQNEIAKKMGVHPSLVSHWMAGRRKPGRNKLKQLAALTGIKVEDLL